MKKHALHRWAIGCALITATIAAYPQGLAQGDEQGSAEPPLEFTLEIDGQKVSISTGAPIKLTIGGKEITAKLIPKADRLFKGRGISFRYPREHAYQVDSSTPGMTQWTLDGNDNVMIVSRVDLKVDPMGLVKSTVDRLVKQFGPANVKQSKREINLGGKRFPSVRLAINVATETVSFEIVGLASGSATFTLMIQDSGGPGGGRSDETKAVLALLDKTFRLEE